MRALRTLAAFVALSTAIMTTLVGVVNPSARAVLGAWLGGALAGAWLATADPAAADDDDDIDDDDDDDEAPLLLVAGVPAVHLDGERQELAGLVAASLEPATLTPKFSAVADIVDILPLAVLRGRYRALFFAAEAADITLAAAKREHDRLDALYRDDTSVAQKTVLQAEAEWRTAEAERYRLWTELDSLRLAARLEWGPVLAELALAADDPGFARLASGKDSLLRAVLPPGRMLPSAAAEASFAHNGGAVVAHHLAPAPRTLAGGGESHFFIAPLPLPAALRVHMDVPAVAEPLQGLALPPGAVVRALGRDWVYAQVDESHFVRREVSLGPVLPDGRYLSGGLESDDNVAIIGAMVLYAEEFRSQIRNEDDDD